MKIKKTNLVTTLYFGERNMETKREFDQLSKELRRSRTGTLDYLLQYRKENEKRRTEPLFV